MFSSSTILVYILVATQAIATPVCDPSKSGSLGCGVSNQLYKRALSGPAVKATTASSLAKYMQYSAAVYCDSVTSKSEWSCGTLCQGNTAGTEIKATFSNNGQGIGIVAVDKSSGTTIIAFRGSTNMDDWGTNLDIALEPVTWLTKPPGKKLPEIPSDMKVHTGFQKNYLGVRSKVQAAIKVATDQYPNNKVVFTGHSLGGALASIAAFDFIYSNTPVNSNKVSVFTYGMPRIGNDKFAAWFTKIPFGYTFRVTCQNDPVPHLPPQLFGYLHFDQEFGISDDGVTHTCSNVGNTGETSNCQEADYLPNFDAHKNGYYFSSGCITK
ncbi:hypothetical protein BASA50_005150 [Batrachochytrium salamandrivorans]|uniref:Fungal lipase-type domain-containing protein n=1 Tax=Batrachochytrium salamandrivorans TaxID=1357716 RepID=A0ABQ8FDK8_9FUNG|nr:hypothetical protein BASA50_005150 [Batrachochytrium salamandrivorans]KAH6599838.1 hypothetical protein BASA61_002451 [Batrachochytrium salamandrivorans]KAH9250620.1 hypothetical protein BASA81_011538 [Batrachochytrium salamandrivorans]KAH9275571.1 hypothetical protein BASA83_001855 [Batrachochytrium salamandrivorans]